jgi:hypothetical protein
MDERLKKAKAELRKFIRRHYSDDMLADLLAHAREGLLVYDTCCCVVGFVNAPHSYRSSVPEGEVIDARFFQAEELEGGMAAADAFCMLGAPLESGNWRACRSVNGDLRRRRIISIIRAEMRRRDAVSVENTVCWGQDGQMRAVWCEPLRPLLELDATIMNK